MMLNMVNIKLAKHQPACVVTVSMWCQHLAQSTTRPKYRLMPGATTHVLKFSAHIIRSEWPCCQNVSPLSLASTYLESSFVSSKNRPENDPWIALSTSYQSSTAFSVSLSSEYVTDMKKHHLSLNDQTENRPIIMIDPCRQELLTCNCILPHTSMRS